MGLSISGVVHSLKDVIQLQQQVETPENFRPNIASYFPGNESRFHSFRCKLGVSWTWLSLLRIPYGFTTSTRFVWKVGRKTLPVWWNARYVPCMVKSFSAAVTQVSCLKGANLGTSYEYLALFPQSILVGCPWYLVTLIITPIFQ